MRVSFVILFLVLAHGVPASAAERPNFVWLLSEDNSKHYLRLFDERGAETPQIEALAKQGLVFENAFSNSPVCSVARTTLITGCYAPRIGTQFHRRTVTVPMPNGLRMFPAYLRQAGYYTTNNQKKDYNAEEGEGVWDESSRQATWRNRGTDQPFFHMQSFATTHESSLHFSRDEMSQATDTDPSSVTLARYHPDTPTFRYTYARYHDRIRQVDGQIGDVVDRLKDEGHLEDTFVFYFGDHGGVLPGSKGYARESGLHVPLVVRIPENWKHLVDVPTGSRVRGFVSFIDFGPTLLHLAGITIPEQVDGRPFLGPNIRAGDLNQRDEVFGYADRFDEKYDLVRSLRKGRFEYVRSYQPFNFDALQNNYRYKMLAYQEWRELFQAGKLSSARRQFFLPRTAEALYDVEQDPDEVTNLAGDREYAQVLQELRSRLTEHVKSQRDLSFFPESFLVSNAFDDPTEFGRSHQAEIHHLVDIANLTCLGFQSAGPRIEAALESENPWHRYWGLIVCSSFGQSAKPFIEQAKILADTDSERLVRVRAAEFLGLIGAGDPRDVISDSLARAESGTEANLILNTLVLLRDGKPGLQFDVPEGFFRLPQRQMGYVNRRLEYLNGPR